MTVCLTRLCMEINAPHVMELPGPKLFSISFFCVNKSKVRAGPPKKKLVNKFIMFLFFLFGLYVFISTFLLSFFIIADVRANLHASQLISQNLKINRQIKLQRLTGT